MTLENVVNEIINNAKQEERKIVQEAEMQARNIIEEQNTAMDEQKKLARENAKKLAKEMEKKQLSAYKLELRKQLMQEKANALKIVVEKTIARIKKMPSAKRKRLLKKFVERGRKELPNSKFLYANSKDRKLLGNVSGLKFAGELNVLGGVVLENADKTVQVDYTFERLLEETKEKNLSEIAKKLFGE